MLGESIQLHDSYLLDDMCVNRPTIVKYNYTGNYVIEAIISLLFIVVVSLLTAPPSEEICREFEEVRAGK